MDEAACNRLAAWFGATLGQPVTSVDLTRLKGGAIQENWRLAVGIAGGEKRAFVLRREASATIRSSRGRAEEFQLLQAMQRAGIAVPAPIALCTDPAVFGGSFFVM